MTRHVSPEIVGTTLIGTDYIRATDGAIMREAEPGRFVRYPRTSLKEVFEDSKHSHRPVLSKLESLEQANVESSKNVSLKYVQAGLEEHFKSDETHVSTIGEDRFKDGKRRVRKKGGSNKKSNPHYYITHSYIRRGPLAKFKEQAERDIIKTCFRTADAPEVGNRHDFFFAGIKFSQPGCIGTDAKFSAWLPARRQFWDIVKSDWLWLFCQVWRYVAGYAPFVNDTVPDAVPDGCETLTWSKLQRAD
jgi:hypothetical protein